MKIDAQRELPLHIPDENKFELDEQVTNIMRKALATDIEERFESVDDFIRALNGEIKVARIDNQKTIKSEETPTKKFHIQCQKEKAFLPLLEWMNLKSKCA